jgi:hypothetical protein
MDRGALYRRSRVKLRDFLAVYYSVLRHPCFFIHKSTAPKKGDFVLPRVHAEV